MQNIKLQIKHNLEMINLYKTSIKNAEWIGISQIPEKKLKISVLLSENEDLRLELYNNDRVIRKEVKVVKKEDKVYLNHIKASKGQLFYSIERSKLTNEMIDKEVSWAIDNNI